MQSMRNMPKEGMTKEQAIAFYKEALKPMIIFGAIATGLSIVAIVFQAIARRNSQLPKGVRVLRKLSKILGIIVLVFAIISTATGIIVPFILAKQIPDDPTPKLRAVLAC